MKYFLKRDVSWKRTTIRFKNLGDLPEANITSESNSYFVYYQNVCTWSYSFVWWTWSEWRKHIDWMALMGVSLTIAPIQEHVWYSVLKQMGLPDITISKFFTGPPFQTWYFIKQIVISVKFLSLTFIL